MLYSAQRLLAFVFVPFTFTAQSQEYAPPLDGPATLIDSVWTDDYAIGDFDDGNAWRASNKRNENGQQRYTTLSAASLQYIGSEGQQYYGPLKADNSNNLGRDNYFSRWFKCGSNATSIIVEYYTAGCGQNSDDGERTTLFVDWYGDMNADGNAKRDYRQQLGIPKRGWNPYSGENEDGYTINDTLLESDCSGGDEERVYWVQRHGARWIPGFNDDFGGLRMKEALTRFRTTIEVEASNDAEGNPHEVVLFNIKMECIFDEAALIDIPPTPESHHESIPPTSESHHEPMIPVEPYTGNEGDDEGEEKMIKLFRVFGAVGVVCAVTGIVLCIGHRCRKKRRMSRQAEQVNNELEARMDPRKTARGERVAVDAVTLDVVDNPKRKQEAYDMRPINPHDHLPEEVVDVDTNDVSQYSS